MAEDKIQEYVVRDGKTFGVDKKQAGDIVFMLESEAAAFLDLIELRIKPRKSEAPHEEEKPATQKKK